MPSLAELEGKTIGCSAKHNTALMYGEAHAVYSNVPNRAPAIPVSVGAVIRL